jgi:multidrug resistance efflux pump
MTFTEVTSKRHEVVEDLYRDAPARPPESRTAAKRSMAIRPFLITFGAVALAGLLGWAMWGVYMEAPWTRDATVRAYVVTMAPEVSGRIVELHVVDNKYVRKGDLLLLIDPTNYRIAVSQSGCSGAAGAGERAEHRRANDCPAGSDRRQPGTIAAGASRARICRLHLLAVDPERADSLIVLEQRHEQVRPNVRQFDQIHDARVAPKISLIGCQVSNVDWRPAFDELREGIAGAYWMYEP